MISFKIFSIRFLHSFIIHFINSFLKTATFNSLKVAILLAGVVRFELTHVGVRVRCLTAWRHPNILGYNLLHPIFITKSLNCLELKQLFSNFLHLIQNNPSIRLVSQIFRKRSLMPSRVSFAGYSSVKTSAIAVPKSSNNTMIL